MIRYLPRTYHHACVSPATTIALSLHNPFNAINIRQMLRLFLILPLFTGWWTVGAAPGISLPRVPTLLSLYMWSNWLFFDCLLKIWMFSIVFTTLVSASIELIWEYGLLSPLSRSQLLMHESTSVLRELFQGWKLEIDSTIRGELGWKIGNKRSQNSTVKWDVKVKDEWQSPSVRVQCKQNKGR